MTGEVERVECNVYRVRSFTDKDKQYYVVLNRGGFTCSCPHNFYRRRVCKHIVAVQRYLGNEYRQMSGDEVGDKS